MTTTPLIERPNSERSVQQQLEALDQNLAQLEGDLRGLWHELVAHEPVLAARVRIAANYLRNASSAMSSEMLI